MAGRRGARSGRGWDAVPAREAATGSGAGRGGRAVGGRAEPAIGDFDWPEGAEPAGAGLAGPLSGPGGGAPTGRGRDRAGLVERQVSEPAGERDESELAREICLRQLTVRPRTRAELAAVLARRGISQEVADQVLDRYDEVGIVDDAAFARAWVTSRHHGRGLARRALANELRQRGVDGETASVALGELDDSTEAETARALVDRKLRTARGEPDVVFRRLVGMLARKGYPPGLAFRVVKEAMAERGAEAAEFSEGFDSDALIDAALEAGPYGG